MTQSDQTTASGERLLDQMLGPGATFRDGQREAIEAMVGGAVLLVDYIIDSGWTLTYAGWLLRGAGCGPIHPLALAVASSRGA